MLRHHKTETAEEREELINIAREQGVEVRFAKRKEDVQAEGIHLVEPDIEKLVAGIVSAIEHGCTIVMVHTKATWPFGH